VLLATGLHPFLDTRIDIDNEKRDQHPGGRPGYHGYLYPIASREGYKVNCFASIAAFLESTVKPDLFLLDIRLPDGNGMELCERLKDDPRYTQVPVILVSAHLQKVGVMGMSSADDFVGKPFDIDFLLVRVAMLLEHE